MILTFLVWFFAEILWKLVVGFFLAALLFGCALFGGEMARDKGRPAAEGFFLGLLLGPFGVLIELTNEVVIPPGLDETDDQAQETI
jgi:hypothetical protein